MMTGASLAHVTITMNVAFALRQSLRGSGCRPFTNDAKVLAAGSVRYPDVTVTCTSFSGRDDVVPNPILVIEVISPSTEREDRGRKKFDYFATPSIRQYAIIEQDARRVDLYTRAGMEWTNEVVESDALLKLSSDRCRDQPRRDLRGHRTRCYSAARGRAASSGFVNGRSCCSDGTMRRALAIAASSMRALTMPTPSPASASTSPHGSTISEWP